MRDVKEKNECKLESRLLAKSDDFNKEALSNISGLCFFAEAEYHPAIQKPHQLSEMKNLKVWPVNFVTWYAVYVALKRDEVGKVVKLTKRKVTLMP